MVLKRSRKIVLAAAASATALGMALPASAGGYYGHGGYYGPYYGGYYGHHGYRHHGYHGRRHGGGGKAAAIALGVIGGAIILNEVAESRARERAYEARYYDRYDRYSTRAVPAYDREAFKRGYEEGYAEGRGAAYEDDGAPIDLGNGDLRNGDVNDLDARLDGGPEPIRFSAAGAYQACMIHARAALGERGFMLAAPPSPETAEDTGGAWKMTATVSAQSQTGESWSRAMYCEADESRVYLLELI